MISLISLSNLPMEKEIKFLYFLLQNRNASISHEKLPSYEDHRSFVLNHPYKTWNIIIKGNIRIGAQYIGYNNTVGIHLLPEYVVYRRNVITKVLENFSPEPGISSLIPNQFIFNVAVSDNDYVDDLIKLGAEQIQSTFQFRKKDI